MSWSSDDSELVTASADNTVGDCLAVCLFACATDSCRQVRVWDAVSWKNSTLTEFVHPCVVYAAKYQPEGTEPRIVATGGLDGLLRLWNRDDGVMLNAIPQHNRSDHH